MKVQFKNRVLRAFDTPSSLDYVKICLMRVAPKFEDLTLQERSQIIEEALLDYDGNSPVVLEMKEAAVNLATLDFLIGTYGDDADLHVNGTPLEGKFNPRLLSLAIQRRKQLTNTDTNPLYQTQVHLDYIGRRSNLLLGKKLLLFIEDLTESAKYSEKFQHMCDYAFKVITDDLTDSDMETYTATLNSIVDRGNGYTTHYDIVILWGIARQFAQASLTDEEEIKKFQLALEIDEAAYRSVVFFGSPVASARNRNQQLALDSRYLMLGEDTVNHVCFNRLELLSKMTGVVC